MQQPSNIKFPKRFDAANLQVAFSSKTDQELQLAHWLLSILKNPVLVKVGGVVTVWALKLRLPIRSIIRSTIYKLFCGGETAQEALQVAQKLSKAQVQTVLDFAAEAQDTEQGFDLVRDEILRNIKLAQQTKSFSYISIKLTGIGHTHIFQKLNDGELLTQKENTAFIRTETRLDAICKAAAEAGISVYIDAEETWMQDPMDVLAEGMMRRYNSKRAVVFNTLQMYRTDRIEYLHDCLKRFTHEQVVLGIKLVRGAYLEKEQQRAARCGYTSPVFARKEDTDRSFNHAIDICLENLDRLEFCAATHNEYSTTYLTRRIQKGEIKDHYNRIRFSQLYGMSDNLTYNLADAGFNVSKYLPYGDVTTAVPYLIRRAEENTSIAGQTGRELQLLEQEMQRRSLIN